MYRFRPFRNGDPPALAELWNRAVPERGAVSPLNAHEFDALVVGKLGFEAQGLIVAERDDRIVAFAHAGFGPEQPEGPSHRLDRQLGTVALVLIEPGLDDPELDQALFLEAERYLQDRGATVIYAGGQYPLNPFYWGLYGGSEFSGALDSHPSFQRAATRAGYEPVATTALLEANLAQPEPRDPRGAVIRRQVRLEVTEDALLPGWWQALALGLFRPTLFQLFDKADDRPVARATIWDIASGVGDRDGRSRAGLIDLVVDPDRRRQGLGQYLVAEVLRHARASFTDVLAAQTPMTNAPALALYESLGFIPFGTSTLFRLPADRMRKSEVSPA